MNAEYASFVFPCRASGESDAIEVQQTEGLFEASIGDAEAEASVRFSVDLATGALRWRNGGEGRVYLIHEGAVTFVSPDASAGYAAYLRGEIDFESTRFACDPTERLRSMPDDAPPFEGESQVGEGDAIVLCNAGFWKYVYDVEMSIDRCKAADVGAWLELMLLRLIQRSYLDGESIAVLACSMEG